MTLFWNGLGLVFCGLAAVLVLKETRKEFVPYMVLTVCILVILAIFPLIHTTADWIKNLAGEGKYGTVLLKAAGISMLTETACELCSSVGEAGLAGYAALVGKAEIFLLTIPLFREITDMAVGCLL